MAAIAALFPGLLVAGVRFIGTLSFHVLLTDLLWLAGIFVVVLGVMVGGTLWDERVRKRQDRNR